MQPQAQRAVFMVAVGAVLQQQLQLIMALMVLLYLLMQQLQLHDIG